MYTKISERVSVNLIYDHTTGTTLPKHIKWHQRRFTIQKVGLHYTQYEGKVLLHLFAVTDETHYFLLSFNTQTLVWRLEEIGEQN